MEKSFRKFHLCTSSYTIFCNSVRDFRLSLSRIEVVISTVFTLGNLGNVP